MSRLYELSGFMSLLGFVGLYTDQKWFLFFFFAVFDFKHFFKKQDDLAQLVEVRRETIVNLEAERYNHSFKLAMDIAKVFQCIL